MTAPITPCPDWCQYHNRSAVGEEEHNTDLLDTTVNVSLCEWHNADGTDGYDLCLEMPTYEPRVFLTAKQAIELAASMLRGAALMGAA